MVQDVNGLFLCPVKKLHSYIQCILLNFQNNLAHFSFDLYLRPVKLDLRPVENFHPLKFRKQIYIKSEILIILIHCQIVDNSYC